MSPTRADSAPKPVVVAAHALETDAASSELAAAVEAILLTTDKPVSEARLAEALELGPGGADAVRGALAALNEAYERTGRAFRAERVAGGYRMTTIADVAEPLAAFHQRRAATRLSRAAIETLAIIAYRQPIARSQIESIRGVASGEVLRAMLERDLVAIVGRAEELGRPMLYGTTRRFLEMFGLSSLKDLPPVEDAVEAPQAERAGGETASASTADVSTGSESTPESSAARADDDASAYAADEEEAGAADSGPEAAQQERDDA